MDISVLKTSVWNCLSLHCSGKHLLITNLPNNMASKRDVKCKESDGSERVRVYYPKFKNGEAKFRDIKSLQIMVIILLFN